MNRYKKMEALLSRILFEKEKIDCEHVRKAARFGCCCRRCRTARKVTSIRKTA
jgi:hypothetical protein